MANARRLLAVVLAVMVCLCSFPVVLAQGYSDIALGQQTEVYLNGNGYGMTYNFTPATEGLYVFSSLGATGGDPYGRLCSADGSKEFRADDNSGDANNFSFVFYCNAGQTYQFQVSFLDAYQAGTVQVLITESQVDWIDSPAVELIYGYDSYLETEYDAQGNLVGQYQRFDFDDYEYEVILKDGTRVQGRGTDCYIKDHWAKVEIKDGQCYDYQWTVGTKDFAMLVVDGVPYSIDVTIIDCPVKSVEVDPVEHILGTGNRVTNSLFDEDGEYLGESPEYQAYDVDPSHLVVNMKDGTSIDVDGNWFEWNGRGVSVDYFNPQSYENQWTQVGEYEVTGSLLGCEFPYTVSLVPSPVKTIEISDLTYIENTHGDEIRDPLYGEYGEYIGESEPYYYYNLYPDFTITLQDGTVIENDGFEYSDRWYGLNFNPDQNFRHQWTVEGTYTVPVECAGYKTSFTVSIVESPVASIVFEPVKIVEKTHGDYVKEWADVENGIYADPYFAYSLNEISNMNYTVTMKDGSVYQDEDVFTFHGEEYPMIFEDAWEQQSYQNPWVAKGSYTAYVDFAGKRGSIPVEILESPVASIEFAPITLKEFGEGYYTRDWITNEYGEPIGETEEYFYYTFSMNDIWVTMKDGTKYNIIHDTVTYEGVDYFFSYDVDAAQGYENQWQAGGTYRVPYSFCGMEGTFPVSVAKDYSNDLYECMGTDSGVIITGYKGQTDIPTLEIPNEINGQPVIGVADLGELQIENILFPDSVVTVGNELFQGMYNLKNIHLGAGMDNFKAQMISNNWDLEAIFVDKNNPHYTVIDKVLYNKDASKLVAVPLGIWEIEIPKTCTDMSVLDLDMYAGLSVSYQEGHPNFITVDGVTYTKDMKTVVSCEKTKEGEYIMPDSVETISPKAFLDCTGLTGVTLSNKVTEIVYSAFAGCTGLTNVTLPENLVTIGEYAFAGTYELSAVDFPDTLQSIEQEAFLDGGLTRVVLPDSVKNVAYYAFYCNPISLLDLGEGVKEIGSFAFAECAIERVTLPDSLTYMGRHAFADNIHLKSLNIGKGLSWIEGYAFSHTGLVSVTIPATVESIGDGAFAYCRDLREADIQNPACMLGNEAFAGCNLQSLTLGNQMNIIPEKAFMGNAFESVKIPDSVTNLVYGGFWDCENLKDITLSKNLVNFGGHMFDNTAWYNAQKDGVVNLDYVTVGWKGDRLAATKAELPETTTLIADFAFEDCANLATVSLPKGLEIIGDYAFYGCKSLAAVTIGKNVKEIGMDAFLGCHSLQSVTVEKGNAHFEMVDGKLCTKDGSVVFDPADQGTVRQIEILRNPYKTQYKKGETVDTAGLELFVRYKGGFHEIITQGFEAKFDPAEGMDRVIVTYGGEETIYWISYEKEEVYVTGVELKKLPAKLTYQLWDEIDPAGLELLVYYSDGSTETLKELTEEYHIWSNTDHLGECVAQVDCPGGYTLEIPITVECAHERTYTHNEIASTCSVHGYESYTECADCGSVVKGSKEPLALDQDNHPNFKYVGKTAATCQKAGYSGDKTCADCGNLLEKGKNLEKQGHTMKWETIVEATTTENGSKTGKCVHCGVECVVETQKRIDTFDNKKVEGIKDVTVTLEGDTTLPGEAVFVVNNVTATLDQVENHTVKSALENANVYDSTTFVVLDMGFVTREKATDGSAIADQKVDFAGEVTITLPAPKEILEGENKIHLYHVMDDGSVEQVEYTLKDGVITFTATGFSYYVFADAADLILEMPMFGDLNGDEKINAKDALQVLKLSVGKVEATPELTLIADVNLDEKVNAKDALEILKFSVGKPSALDEFYSE